jgi:hypothetical protein
MKALYKIRVFCPQQQTEATVTLDRTHLELLAAEVKMALGARLTKETKLGKVRADRIEVQIDE